VRGITLEITLAPADVRHARHVLPHQLRVWAGQVDEIVCTLDVLSALGRRLDARDPGVRALVDVVDACLAPYPHARRVLTDPSPARVEEVGRAFFAGGRIPLKDWRGLGFYSYFCGLYEAANDHVLHLDSDMLFGGGSETWLAEAVDFLARRDDCLACQPLLAPPAEDGDLRGKRTVREPCGSLAYRFETFSSRCFLLDRRTLRERLLPLELVPWRAARSRAPVIDWLRAARTWSVEDVKHPLTLRHPPYDFAENQIGAAMERAGLVRVSLLGSPPGMWQLHPAAVRTERIYAALPGVIRCVEQGRVAEEQRGRPDLVDAMLELAEAEPEAELVPASA
jgi:hypothetical protein